MHATMHTVIQLSMHAAVHAHDHARSHPHTHPSIQVKLSSMHRAPLITMVASRSRGRRTATLTVHHCVLEHVEEDLLVFCAVADELGIFQGLVLVFDFNLNVLAPWLQLNDVFDFLGRPLQSKSSQTLLQRRAWSINFKQVFAFEEAHFGCN